MNEQQMNEFINSIGAMAEMTSLYYKGLLSNGVPADAAMVITGEFVKAAFPHK